MEQEVISLRASLEASRALGLHWRRELFLATGIAIAASGLALSNGWESIRQSTAGLLQEAGIVETQNGVNAAYAAYQRGDGATSLRLAQPLAEQRDARAQALMGLVYRSGRGILKNDQEAARWFQLAAEQGEAIAQFELGMMYLTGRAVPQSFADAARWIRLSADAGNAEAQFNLGVMYLQGKGVPQSNLDAHIWFNLAAARFASTDRNKRRQAIKARTDVAAKMTAKEINEAHELARHWKPQPQGDS